MIRVPTQPHSSRPSGTELAVGGAIRSGGTGTTRRWAEGGVVVVAPDGADWVEDPFDGADGTAGVGAVAGAVAGA